MDEFKEIYSGNEIGEDKNWINSLEKEWHVDSVSGKRRKAFAERLEKLATAIFYKFLKNDFIVARTSRFDDIKAGADNIIIERRTGNIVCAFDEVGDAFGERFQEKQWKTLHKNTKGGTNIKYGLKLEKDKTTDELKLSRCLKPDVEHKKICQIYKAKFRIY